MISCRCSASIPSSTGTSDFLRRPGGKWGRSSPRTLRLVPGDAPPRRLLRGASSPREAHEGLPVVLGFSGCHSRARRPGRTGGPLGTAEEEHQGCRRWPPVATLFGLRRVEAGGRRVLRLGPEAAEAPRRRELPGFDLQALCGASSPRAHPSQEGSIIGCGISTTDVAMRDRSGIPVTLTRRNSGFDASSEVAKPEFPAKREKRKP